MSLLLICPQQTELFYSQLCSHPGPLLPVWNCRHSKTFRCQSHRPFTSFSVDRDESARTLKLITVSFDCFIAKQWEFDFCRIIKNRKSFPCPCATVNRHQSLSAARFAVGSELDPFYICVLTFSIVPPLFVSQVIFPELFWNRIWQIPSPEDQKTNTQYFLENKSLIEKCNMTIRT